MYVYVQITSPISEFLSSQLIFVSHFTSNGHLTSSGASVTRTATFLLIARLILVSTSRPVAMASESVFSSSKEALLFAVKKLQKSPAYQDRWIVDVDVAAFFCQGMVGEALVPIFHLNRDQLSDPSPPRDGI